jgi:hypothetical protein
MVRRPTFVPKKVWDECTPKQQTILRFLAEHRGRWYRAKEIQRATRLPDVRSEDVFNLHIKLGNLMYPNATFEIRWNGHIYSLVVKKEEPKRT